MTIYGKKVEKKVETERILDIHEANLIISLF